MDLPMPLPRKYQIIPGQPGFYHCISRCVRRAWLCGRDPLTGKDYDHRRDWMIERLRTLSSCFVIDIYAYSIMSNHLHVVLHVDPDRTASLTDAQVARRYRAIWRWRDPTEDIDTFDEYNPEEIQRWRSRLSDVSWFMKALKEPMSRLANAEDGCKGAFWEGRFRSIPLLDEQALITCLMYVDLNPVKAGISDTLEDSDYTSIQQRLRALEQLSRDTSESQVDETTCLSPVIGDKREKRHHSITISNLSYIDLIRQTAKAVVTQEQQFSHRELERLALSPKGWVTMATEFLHYFRSAAGGNSAFERFMDLTGRTRRQDQHGRTLLFPS